MVRAVTLGASMLLLQGSIGALNDASDAALDAAGKPWKPIPRGLVSRAGAIRLAIALGAAGLALSGVGSWPTVVIATAGLACGYAYDLRLSRTPLSWLPLAVALPLLPIHAWLGASGVVPAALLPVVPAGVLAGAALALGNGIVDLPSDRAGGSGGAVVRLGARAAWGVHALLLAGVAAVAFAAAPQATPGAMDDPGGALALARTGGFGVGVVLLVVGTLLVGGRRAGWRTVGWQLEALAVAAIGVAWLAAIAGTQPAA